MKEHFDFVVDRKCTVWERTRFSIEAESLEQAKEILRNASYAKRCDLVYADHYECEVMHDTIAMMTPQENNGRATEEWISYQDGATIINNATKED
jgi:hypothetical protein